MDVQGKIDEIAAALESARAMPMSASCIVNRGELLAMLDELRHLLPRELRGAAAVIADRDALVEQGREAADRIVAEGERERARLVAVTEVATEARREADRLVAEANEEVESKRREVDEYVDAKLAHFEIMLQRTMNAVVHGRDKLRQELDALPALPAISLPDDQEQPALRG
ncbi:MAG: hypothetical protein ACR2J0_02960 [Mycobacteriales bacterium]